MGKYLKNLKLGDRLVFLDAYNGEMICLHFIWFSFLFRLPLLPLTVQNTAVYAVQTKSKDIPLSNISTMEKMTRSTQVEERYLVLFSNQCKF